MLFLTSLAVLAALMLQRGFPMLESEQTLGSNLSFLALININIIAVMILGFVVVRNIIRLIIDRRRNILGAKLRTRLVFAFVFLSMVPTVLLFLVAQGMVEGVLEDWFSPKVEIALDNSRKLAHQLYDYIENDTLAAHQRAVSACSGMKEEERSESHAVSLLLAQFVAHDPELEAYVLKKNGEIFASSLKGRGLHKEPPVSFTPSELDQAMVLKKSVESSIRGEYIQVITYLFTIHEEQFYLISLRYIQPQISSAIKELLAAGEEYSAVKSYQRPLASSYFLTLVVVTLLIIFAAISIAFFLSRGLAVPIGLLAKGTEQIANGNLHYHIPELGDDELSVLVKGFNKMTSDLRLASSELVSRTRYIEAILSSLDVGVFSLDEQGRIKTFNDACRAILHLSDDMHVIDALYAEVLPREFVNYIDEINVRNLRGKNQVVSKTVNFNTGHSLRHLSITLSRLFEENTRGDVGLVILVDDITELERAQRMAAWQEVARRIAHEIKNPLTPIQLSAERIQKVYDKYSSAGAVPSVEHKELQLISDATGVIINQVQHLRSLVNEFSNFARLPKSELTFSSLPQVLIKGVDAFKTAHPDILFELIIKKDIPKLLLDEHQFERVMVNLLDNAVGALHSAQVSTPRVVVISDWDEIHKYAFVEVIDNGPGVPDNEKQRIFEPYYSKKSNGTGLGLAIVKTVVSDHNGFIRVYDNPEGQGLVMRIELPIP